MSGTLEALLYVLELGEYSRCWSVIRHDPEREKKSEESEDVSEENDTLCKRQMLREEHVEANSQDNEQEDHERSLP